MGTYIMKIVDCIQGSEEWKAARLGKPTASEFSRLVNSTGARSKSLEGYARQLASEIFAGKDISGFDGNNVWMERGRDLEAEAIALYEFTNDTPVTRVGFCTTDGGQYGCSPDGLVGEDGGLEIKCLKAERHIEAVTYHAKHKKAPSGYVQQVQGGLFVTGREWWDLMFFNPELPPLVIRHVPDLQLHAALAAALADCIRERDQTLITLRSQ